MADYGYTKLKDLFEALPHVVQIIGEGSRAMITLSHRAQVKRFTSDLLKVLKTQPSKQIALYDLPTMFEKSTHKCFKISDYGVSFFFLSIFKIVRSARPSRICFEELSICCIVVQCAFLMIFEKLATACSLYLHFIVQFSFL